MGLSRLNGLNDDELVDELNEIARKCRVEIIKMVFRAQAGHPGGSLSEIDLLTGLYATTLNVKPDEPKWPDRDRFVLSKGHASPGMYSILAEMGFISYLDLESYRVLGGVCQGHVDMKHTPGVDFSAGSLGMGLSFGLGCAFAARFDKSNRNCYVMLGDGELQEGSVWEAMMAARHHELGNLKVILDCNGIQNDDYVDTQMRMFNISEKWASFGWKVKEIDGHDMYQIIEGLRWLNENNDLPSILIAKTIKGKGVSYMENNPKFHGAAPNEEQYSKALMELGDAI
ncbi:MAG TPA: transketolase [Candidatus Poseidoniaceae archaeon]|nr:transketolase [Candidatus Poseidoniaceae archaeon]